MESPPTPHSPSKPFFEIKTLSLVHARAWLTGCKWGIMSHTPGNLTSPSPPPQPVQKHSFSANVGTQVAYTKCCQSSPYSVSRISVLEQSSPNVLWSLRFCAVPAFDFTEMASAIHALALAYWWISFQANAVANVYPVLMQPFSASTNLPIRNRIAV